MYALDPLPASFEELLLDLSLGKEKRKIAAQSVLTSTGMVGCAALVLNEDKLAIIEQESDGEDRLNIILDIPLKKLTGMRLASLDGGGVVIAEVEGVPREVMRVSPGNVILFGGIARKIDKFLDKPEPSFIPKKKGDAKKTRSEKKTEEKEAELKRAAEGEEKKLDFSESVEKYNESFRDKYKYIYSDHPVIASTKMTRKAIIFRVLGFAREKKWWMLLLFALMSVSSLIALFPPLIMKVIVDDVLRAAAAVSDKTSFITLLGWAMFAWAGIMVSGTLLNIIRGRLAVWVGANISHNIRRKTFNHLEKLSLSYFNKHQTGALISRVNTDTRALQGFLVDGIQFTVTSLLTLFFVITILLIINWQLGLLVILPMPVVVIISKLVWHRIFTRFRKLWTSYSRISAFLSDTFSGIRVVKAFGQEDHEIEKFNKVSKNNRDKIITAQQTWQTLIPSFNLIIQFSLILVWYFGGNKVLGNKLSIGSLIAYVMLVRRVYQPLQLLTRLNEWLTNSLTAAERIFEILDTEPLIIDAKNAESVEKMNGRLEFENVSFGYEPHKPVLKDVSFEIQPGEMIGLVGHSGAGKSTTMNLIMRLFDVDEGRILLDGKDLRDYRIEDLRENIGVVLQDSFLFTGTVRENLLYAKPDATEEDLLKAAMDANVHEFIMEKPDGYDTLLGERGAGLSGGEKQRIAIARALLKNPKILILDEATSSVDTETEAKIQAALRRLVEGRTTIAIAHRLSTLRHADRLIVLEEGKVTEIGAHEELVEKGGAYRKLVTIQTEWARTIAVGG